MLKYVFFRGIGKLIKRINKFLHEILYAIAKCGILFRIIAFVLFLWGAVEIPQAGLMWSKSLTGPFFVTLAPVLPLTYIFFKGVKAIIREAANTNNKKEKDN